VGNCKVASAGAVRILEDCKSRQVYNRWWLRDRVLTTGRWGKGAFDSFSYSCREGETEREERGVEGRQRRGGTGPWTPGGRGGRQMLGRILRGQN